MVTQATRKPPGTGDESVGQHTGESSNSDFVVRLKSAATDLVAHINCDDTDLNRMEPAHRKLGRSVARLHTSTTHVEITDVVWAESTTVILTPRRLGFCMLLSGSLPTSIECGYSGATEESSRPGHVLMMLPGRRIRGHSTSGRFRTITCSFDPRYAEGVVGSLADLSQQQLMGALDLRRSLVSTILLRLLNEAMHPGPLCNVVVESFGHALLVECAHWLLSEKAEPGGRGKLTMQHFAIVDEYLNGLSGKLPNVADLAKACGYSERYFAKLFRAQAGCSVAQYIKSAQIVKAQTYLRETDLPLKEVAFRLGFSTPANFSSAFRAATGVTPRSLRRGKSQA